MNIFQSWLEEVKGQKTSSKFGDLFSLIVWKRVRNHRNQRIQRGFSDQDMWSGGEHIMQMISESLKWYDANGISNWSESFKTWRAEETDFGYKSLKQVYSDIDNYLNLEKSGWSTDLDLDTSNLGSHYIPTQPETASDEESNWINKKTGKRLSRAQVSRRIAAHHAKVEKVYAKAIKAMTFWAHHAREFWD